jgi:hypothetical protein
MAENTERRADLKSKLSARLHDPVQLRIVVIASIVFLGYVAIYTPLSEQIAKTSRKVDRDHKLLALAESYEQLQKEYHNIDPRIPKQTDTKEWVRYMLEGTRQFPEIKVINFDCTETKGIGPFRGIAFKIPIEGSFLELLKFLNWIETNPRLLRADDLKLSPARDRSATKKDSTTMSLRITGITS